MMTLNLSNLRIAQSYVLREYLANTALWKSIGNSEFASLIRNHHGPGALQQERDTPTGDSSMCYHSWLPGFIELHPGDAQVLADWIAANSFDDRLPGLAAVLVESQFSADIPLDTRALAKKSIDTFSAVQNRYELATFFSRVHSREPATVVEIGSARGGTLYGLTQLARNDALIVSIDLPGAPNCGGQTQLERELFGSFRRPGQDMGFIPTSSQHHSTREELKRMLDGRTIDLLFIDGDHSYGGVLADFEMYGSLVGPGGMITLHDINLVPSEWGPGNDVGIFWSDIAGYYRIEEIVDPLGVKANRPLSQNESYSWGIGIVYM